MEMNSDLKCDNLNRRVSMIADELGSLPRFTEMHDPRLLDQYLDVLKHPEAGLFVVHVAGTNGKGSVTRMLRGLLTLSGRRTGGFYSPHLVRINERMEVDGEEIGDGEFIEVYEEYTDAVKGRELPEITFFETVFLLALLFFRRRKATHVVLETGLGGRLDATTSIPAQLCVITQIGLDHEEYLGTTIAEIAAEKAGIITGTSPLVIHTESDEADRVILKKAAEMGVEAVVNAGDEIVSNVSFSSSGIDFSLENDYDRYQSFHLPCFAEYQIRNAVTAIAASRLLLADRSVEEADRLVREMLQCFSWNGRLTEAAPGLWLDGAHNPSAADELVKSLPPLMKEYNRLIFAASKDKNVAGVLSRLNTLPWNEIWLVPYTGGRSVKREALEKLAADVLSGNAECRLFRAPDEVMAALRHENKKEESGTFTLATGSLYLVGELLKDIQASEKNDAEKGDEVG